MRIAVCMKQVVDCGAPLSETGGVVRTAQNSLTNPADLLALEAAVLLKRESGACVSIFTMGPAHAEELLRESARLGPDELFLLSDPLFAGSDTYITASILCRALATQGPFDLILCGDRAIDGETGQVPGALSVFMDMPWISNVTRFRLQGDSLVCKSISEEGELHIAVSLPVILSVSCGLEGICHPLSPYLSDLRRGQGLPVFKMNHTDLTLDPRQVGSSASPTRVYQVQRPVWSRTCERTACIGEGVQKTLAVIYGL